MLACDRDHIFQISTEIYRGILAQDFSRIDTILTETIIVRPAQIRRRAHKIVNGNLAGKVHTPAQDPKKSNMLPQGNRWDLPSPTSPRIVASISRWFNQSGMNIVRSFVNDDQVWVKVQGTKFEIDQDFPRVISRDSPIDDFYILVTIFTFEQLLQLGGEGFIVIFYAYVISRGTTQRHNAIHTGWFL